jgi:hypothetical protein
MTIALTLFDLTDLNPTAEPSQTCLRCGQQPATLTVRATQNLLGLHPTWMTHTWYRQATHTAYSGPCCEYCAWNVAASWWGGWLVCPSGVCSLWAHALDGPKPGANCTRCHRETTVIVRTQMEVAA